MATPLHVLILEDRPADAALMVHELRRAGFDPVWRRVETEEDYLAHLHAGLDVIQPASASKGALASPIARRIPGRSRLRTGGPSARHICR